MTDHAADRLTELDALRGIAALLVLACHVGQIVPHDLAFLPGRVQHILFHLTPLRVVEFGRPAVLFFFVLSGYVLARALMLGGSPGALAYAVQRTLRLGLPVVATVLGSALLGLLLAGRAPPQAWGMSPIFAWPEPLGAGRVAMEALLLPPDGELATNEALWSLVHEWRLSLLLPAVLLFRGRVAAFAAVVAAATWLGLVAGAAMDRAILGAHLAGSVAATLYFTAAIGTGAAMALLLGPGVPALTRSTKAGFAALILIAFSTASDVATYAGSALLILLARQPGRFQVALRRAPLQWLGRRSFSLYLVHLPVLIATIHLLWDRLPKPGIAAVGVAASLAAAAVFHPLVEAPARRLARRAEAALSSRRGAASARAGAR
jgi:peptidoglycan/LPS O-acetylase OafA/YrhL